VEEAEEEEEEEEEARLLLMVEAGNELWSPAFGHKLRVECTRRIGHPLFSPRSNCAPRAYRARANARLCAEECLRRARPERRVQSAVRAQRTTRDPPAWDYN